MPSFGDIGSSLLKKFTSNASARATTSIPQLALKDLKNLKRPAPAWRWNLIMPSLPGNSTAASISPPKNFLSSISSLINKDPAALSVVCESISIPPMISLGRQDRYFEGRMVTFPGLPSYDTITAVFYEDETYATMNYFRKWHNLVYDPEKRIYGVPSTYGLNIEFIALPVTDYTDVNRYAKLKMYACWPTNIDKLTYGNTTDRIRISVDIAFHTMDMEIVGGPNTSPGLDAGTVINTISKWRS